MGSEGRRILRSFIGSWLDDRLISGPIDELRDDLIEKLARRGWYVVNGNLVTGDRAKGTRRTCCRRFIVAAALTVGLTASAGVVLVGSRHGTPDATHLTVTRSASR